MGVLDNIFSYEVNDSYDGTLLATVSRISATAICATYLILYFILAPEYGFIYDPKEFFNPNPLHIVSKSIIISAPPRC